MHSVAGSIGHALRVYIRAPFSVVYQSNRPPHNGHIHGNYLESHHSGKRILGAGQLCKLSLVAAPDDDA
jgi:hypothetical protein